MRIKSDPVSGAFYFRLRDGETFETLELGPGAYVDIDEDGTVLQLEFLSLEEFRDLATGGFDIPTLIKDPEAFHLSKA